MNFMDSGIEPVARAGQNLSPSLLSGVVHFLWKSSIPAIPVEKEGANIWAWRVILATVNNRRCGTDARPRFVFISKFASLPTKIVEEKAFFAIFYQVPVGSGLSFFAHKMRWLTWLAKKINGWYSGEAVGPKKLITWNQRLEKNVGNCNFKQKTVGNRNRTCGSSE